MISNRWIFPTGNVHLNRESEHFNNITGNYMFHLNSISQQYFYLPLTGNQCDKCPSGFYKNSSSPGLDCAPCPCNNNIDLTDPESCNRVTGECTKCLHNTHGANCQFCKPGYFGSALNQSCQSK